MVPDFLHCFCLLYGKSRLQSDGFRKNEQLGGRASMMEIDGYKFDMGPSWYWMPDIFERFLQILVKKVSDYYELEKLSPAYRVVLVKMITSTSKILQKKIIETFERIEPGSGKHLKKIHG